MGSYANMSTETLKEVSVKVIELMQANEEIWQWLSIDDMCEGETTGRGLGG